LEGGVTLVAPTVEVYFDGVNATDITSYAHSVEFSRGRAQEFDEINAGTCRIGLRNHSGRFVPYDVIVEGSELLDEAGDVLLDEAGEVLLDETSSAFASNIVPGRRIKVSIGATVVFDGVIDDWNYAYTPDGRADAMVEAVDALAELAAKRFAAFTATPEQRPGERFDEFLARAEVDYGGSTNFDRGVDRLQGNAISNGRNVLTEIQLISRTDRGAFFASRTGALTYVDRHSAAVVASSVDFSDDGSETPFHGVTPDFGREFLFTRVTVEREGGTVQVADVSSGSEHGVRTLSLEGLLLLTDGYALNLAEFLADTYSTPRTRIRGLIINLDDLTSGQRTAVAGLELADMVTVTWTPEGTQSSTTQELVVEGIRHAKSTDSAYIVELQLSQRVQAGVFTLDSATLGVLDTSRLAY
jgi:hypothetical protein